MDVFILNYNFGSIGNRIVNTRKGMKLSQADLIEALSNVGVSVGRNTLSAIENGSANGFSLDLLVGLCKIFDCDIGYLLCEYDPKRHITADICAATGLSEKAVERIQGGEDYYYNVAGVKVPHPEKGGLTPSEILVRLLERDDFWRVLGNMSGWTKSGAQDWFRATDEYNPLQGGLPCAEGYLSPNPAFEPYADSFRDLFLAAAVKHFGEAAEGVLSGYEKELKVAQLRR